MRHHFTRARRWSLAVALLALLGVMLLVTSAAAAKPLPTGAVSGQVLSQAGKPVAGVSVIPYVYTYAGADWWVWERVPGVTAVTTRKGSYTMKLPAGTYRMLFLPSDLKKYAIEAYPNAPAPDFGDDIVVKYGRTTTRISAILDAPAHMEGTVWDASTGEDPATAAAVPGVHLQVVYQGTARINRLESASAVSDANGHYEVWGLKPYPGLTLDVSDPTDDYWGPWYQSTDYFEFPPAWPAGVRYDDIAVEPTDLDKLTGVVHDGGEIGIAGITVNVYGDGIDPVSTQTGVDGSFAFKAGQLRLGPADFYMTEWVIVEFVDQSHTYYDMYYQEWPDADGAEPVTAELGKTTAIDVRMWPTAETPPWEW
jgi:hypothetical protein